MNIALIGATGFVGSKVLTEALSRGHKVTAIVRDVSKLQAREGLTTVVGNATDAATLATQVKGHDAIVSAYNGERGTPGFAQSYIAGTRAVIAAAKQSGVNRVLWVGGAGSLFVAPGVQLVDTPQFPEEYRLEARTARDALNIFRDETQLAWSFVSPAPLLVPGQRTGSFRLGGDQVLMDGDKPGSISVDDLAVAIVDELEKSAHVRERFTLAY
jgi:uncharacterized protein